MVGCGIVDLYKFPHFCSEFARNVTRKLVPSTVSPGGPVMALLDGPAPVMAATNGPRGPFMAITLAIMALYQK